MDPNNRAHISSLKYFAQSAAHYHEHVTNPKPPTGPMKVGALTDRYLFSATAPVVYPGPVRRGKEYDAFREQHPGEEIYIESEVAHARAIADSVRSNHVAMALLDGERQRELLWDYCGRACSSTPDVYTGERVVELKTAQSASPARFPRDGLRMGYHAQLAFYAEALRTLKLSAATEAYIVCVESSAPYPVVVYQLTARALDFGLRLCRSWTEQLLVCESSGRWPGYSDALVDFDVPDDDVSLMVGGELMEVG